MKPIIRLAPVLLALCLATCGTFGPDDSDWEAEECPPEEKCDGTVLTPITFEYIVVGSGAGGGPLAANLARKGHKVLLLDAGGDMTGKPEYQVPSFNLLASEQPEMSWAFYARHYDDESREAKDKVKAGEGIFYPRGSALGGSTAVNAMITVYPHDRDWQEIADLTKDASWSPSKMRAYFDRLERRQYGGQRETSGWLATEKNIPFVLDLAALGIYQAAGIDPLGARDVNDPRRDGEWGGEGAYSVPLATNKGHRNGPAEYVKQT